MTRIIAIGIVITCLSLGASLGAVRHAVDLGELHVQTLYDAHGGMVAMADTIYAKKLTVAQSEH